MLFKYMFAVYASKNRSAGIGPAVNVHHPLRNMHNSICIIII